MGFYEDQVLPRFVDVALGSKGLIPLRRRACAGLQGRVLEIGFGSGRNVPFYPEAVTSVDAVEPAGVGWKLAAKRLAASPVTVRRAGLDGAKLPAADDTYDAVLSTWTLCTIPDVSAALQEVRRVLKPGGTLHFLEHGLAPDPEVQRWQRRLEPIQKRIAGGCHLTRSVSDLITDAGFGEIDLDSWYEKGPKPLSAFSIGTAVSA
jgi:ubiquinone/menaquinone biosynthesis C-methylase UbiE